MTKLPRPLQAIPGALALTFALFALFAGACSSSGPSGPVGGPVTGALDTHCVENGQQIKQPIGECLTGAAAEPDPDAGAPDPTGDLGETLYNAEGDDDDCKYHLSWTATPIRVDQNVTFTVVTTRLFDGAPATEAGIRAEVFLNSTHPVQSPSKAAPEGPAGTYKVGPIKFDAPGQWTVRFHLYEDCSDAPADSPHGHAAFYVDVPDPNAVE
jgi:hypothetical protein